MNTRYQAVTCAALARAGHRPPRHYGYTIRIDPPVLPDPPADLTPIAVAHTKACDSCGQPTPLARLHDITSCGDWLTVCAQCRDRITGPPRPQHWQGWYKFKADAVHRAEVLNHAEAPDLQQAA